MVDTPSQGGKSGHRDPVPWLSLLLGGFLVIVLVVGYMVSADGGAANGGENDASTDIRIGAGIQ